MWAGAMGKPLYGRDGGFSPGAHFSLSLAHHLRAPEVPSPPWHSAAKPRGPRKEQGAAGEKAQPTQTPPPTASQPTLLDGRRAEWGFGTGRGSCPSAPGTGTAVLVICLCKRSRSGTKRALGTRGTDREEAGGRKVWAAMPAGIAGVGVEKGRDRCCGVGTGWDSSCKVGMG